ncbi:MAG: hypothetical protein J6V54_01980 [Bacteroidales bacterium]|nr:hypothetical protein [Bacteroidales bacterium]
MTRKVKSFFLCGAIPFIAPRRMVQCMMPDGTILDAPWYNICPAKDFRTPMFIPRSANICTMENHGLYHSRPTKVCTLSDKNHVVYDPKLPYLRPETMALLMPKPHGLGCQTLQFFF